MQKPSITTKIQLFLFFQSFKSLKQSKNSFVWNLLHKFVFLVSQIVCKLCKKNIVCKKTQQKSFVKKSGNIKEDSFETIPRKKDHYNTTKRFCLFFMGYEAYRLESVQDFLIKLDMKPCMHLVEKSIFHLITSSSDLPKL